MFTALTLIGVVGICLLIFYLKNLEWFFLILLAIKPLIDLTVTAKLGSFGGQSFNAIEIIGGLVFLVTGYAYLSRNREEKIHNEKFIWLFWGMNFLTISMVVYSGTRTFLFVADSLVKMLEGHFIYLIFHRFMKNEQEVMTKVGIIWYSTIFVSIVSIIVYFTGSYNYQVTGTVERFAGLYRGTGGPIYNAMFSLFFGALYLELYGRQTKKIPFFVRGMFYITVFFALFMLKLTMARSALLMLLVFLIMWYGFYKRFLLMILPLIVVTSYYVYKSNEDVQNRFSREKAFFTAERRTVELASRMGTGRVGRWQRLIRIYDDEYTFVEQMLGRYRTFGAHNQYLAYLMQIGFLGLSVFAVLIFRFYKKLLEVYKMCKRPDVYMALVLLTIFCIIGLTGHPFFYTTQLWYLMILLSLINASRLNKLSYAQR